MKFFFQRSTGQSEQSVDLSAQAVRFVDDGGIEFDLQMDGSSAAAVVGFTHFAVESDVDLNGHALSFR